MAIPLIVVSIPSRSPSSAVQTVSKMVARRVYVPARGNNEKATFPNGQYVDLDVAGTFIAGVDDEDGTITLSNSIIDVALGAADDAAIAPPGNAVAAPLETVINPRCRIVRLSVKARELNAGAVASSSSSIHSSCTADADADKDDQCCCKPGLHG